MSMSAPQSHTAAVSASAKPGITTVWRIAPRRARVLVTSLAVVAVLGVIGTCIASAVAVQNYSNWNATTDRVSAQSDSISQLESALSRAQDDVARAERNLVPQAELAQQKQAVTAAESALGERESAVKVREDAVTAKEQFVRQTSLADGLYTVGVSMDAGTYRTENTNTRCYWAIYVSGTNYDDIEQNDLGSTGVLTVTIREGQDFETSSCGTWVKVG